jgi:hypothetical protein
VVRPFIGIAVGVGVGGDVGIACDVTIDVGAWQVLFKMIDVCHAFGLPNELRKRTST